jgi:hypothetical protein
MFSFKENNLRACPEGKRILQKACFGVKRMRFSRKLRRSVPLDKVYGTGIVFVGIYVNDCLVIGNENGINDVIDGLKTYKFGLKIANDLKDYLSCRILTDYESKITFVMQHCLIINLKENLKKKSTI